MSGQERPEREGGIDAARFAGAVAVVLLHSLPQTIPPPAMSDTLVTMACRFAVPFFFIVSGYFLTTRGRSLTKLAVTPVIKLAPVHFGAIAIYYVASFFVPLGSWDAGFTDLRGGGPVFHLWFLPVLALSLAAVGAAESLVGLRVTIGAALALTLFGLARTSYGDLIGSAAAGARSGWYYGPMLVAVGMVIRRWNVRLSVPITALMVIASYGLLVLEEVALQHLTGVPKLRSHDFMGATFVFGASVLLFARSVDAKGVVGLLAPAGRLSLGIYVFHVLFLRIVQAAWGERPWATIAVAVATLASTLAFTWALARLPVARRLVTTERARPRTVDERARWPRAFRPATAAR